MRLSMESECPSWPASSSRQMTDAVVPIFFASWRWVNPALVRRPAGTQQTGRMILVVLALFYTKKRRASSHMNI